MEPGKLGESAEEPRLDLFVFFTRNNCHVCLEALQALNGLPPQFVVTGIVPVFSGQANFFT